MRNFQNLVTELINMTEECDCWAAAGNRQKVNEALRKLNLATLYLNDICVTLQSAHDFIDNYADVIDGDDGQPEPNSALHICGQIEDALNMLENIGIKTNS